MPALARKSSRQTTKPARSSTAPANVAERQGDRVQGSIRHLVATDGPQLETTANSLLACLKEGKQGFWLDIENPGDADYDLLEKTFKFHPLTLEDIRNRNQRPKVEEFPGYAFVVLFTAELVNELAEIREHHIYVSPQYLVSVHLEPSQPLAELRQRIKDNPDLTRRSLPFLFYLVASAMDVYLSTVSNRLNLRITRLTVFATLFLPLTFLTGFFGMNFAWLVGHIAPAWTFWILAVGVMAATAGAQLWYYRRLGWI